MCFNKPTAMASPADVNKLFLDYFSLRTLSRLWIPSICLIILFSSAAAALGGGWVMGVCPV